jgi:CO/xanthine dehydrogenase FAD-binding subunit
VKLTMAFIDYTYHRPQSLAAACELGRIFGTEGRFLGGGTELLVDLRSGRECVDHVISLQAIPDLAAIKIDQSVLRIGAMATLSQIAESREIREFFPPLREAVLQMAGTQIRNQGTIGGNFCRAVPCADTPPLCIAAAGRVRIVGPERERTIPAEAFFVDARRTVLQSNEILTEIQIPSQPRLSGASYQRFSLRKGSALAVAAVAARVILKDGRIEEARIVLGAVAPVPLPASRAAGLLAGRLPSAEVFAEAAKTAAAEAQPITDLRATEQFRRELVEVLAVRALQEATRRALGERS